MVDATDSIEPETNSNPKNGTELKAEPGAEINAKSKTDLDTETSTETGSHLNTDGNSETEASLETTAIPTLPKRVDLASTQGSPTGKRRKGATRRPRNTPLDSPNTSTPTKTGKKRPTRRGKKNQASLSYVAIKTKRRSFWMLLISGILLLSGSLILKYLDTDTRNLIARSHEPVAAGETFNATAENLVYYPTQTAENLASYDCNLLSASIISYVELEADSTGEYFTSTGTRSSGNYTDYYYTCANAPDDLELYILTDTEFANLTAPGYHQILTTTSIILSVIAFIGAIFTLANINKTNYKIRRSWQLADTLINPSQAHQRRLRPLSIGQKIIYTILMGTFVTFVTAPLTLMAINLIRDQNLTSEYSASIAAYSDQIPEVLSAAHEYNQNLYENGSQYYGEIEDPYSATSSTATTGETGEEQASDQIQEAQALLEDYYSQLNLTGIMATIEYPNLGINMAIYHGTSGEVLDIGAGHLYGSSLPVGGTNTHAVLTAHTGYQNRILFDMISLKRFQIGDIFYIHVLDQTLAYRIIYYNIIDPNAADIIDYISIKDNQDIVTLFTCYPYGINSQRILVTGQRVDLDSIESTSDALLLPYLLLVIAAGAWLVTGKITIDTWKD